MKPVMRNRMILTGSQAQDKNNLCMKKLTHTFVVNHRGILWSYDIWESLSFRTSWIIFEDWKKNNQACNKKYNDFNMLTGIRQK